MGDAVQTGSPCAAEFPSDTDESRDPGAGAASASWGGGCGSSPRWGRGLAAGGCDSPLGAVTDSVASALSLCRGLLGCSRAPLGRGQRGSSREQAPRSRGEQYQKGAGRIAHSEEVPGLGRKGGSGWCWD